MTEIPRLIYDSYDDVRALVDRIYERGDAYTYDFETLGSQPAKLRVTGLGLAYGSEPDEGNYILTEHTEHPHLQWDKVLDIIKPLFEDDSMTQVAHNSLFDATILDVHGVNLHTNTYDTMVMAWLLNTETPNGLKGLVKRLYGYEMAELSEFVKKESVSWHPGKILRLDQAPMEKLEQYAVDDVLWCYRLWRDALGAIREDEDLDKIYHDLYQEYLLILAQMQSDGVSLDTSYLRQREEETEERLEKLTMEMVKLRPGQDFDADTSSWTYNDIDIQRKNIPELQDKWSKGRKNGVRERLYQHPTLAHKLFNPSSNHEIHKIIFDELGLTPVGEKGESGLYSVAVDVLSKLKHDDSSGFIEALMEYNIHSKLQGTYHIGLQELVDADGKIRTSYNACLKTGRLSSSKPNLQNIPARTDAGKLIRKAFVASPGRKLLVADYSQVELRITAHLSGDEVMIDGFRQGADPHSITTYAVFGDQMDCTLMEVKEKYPHLRAIGKLLNFALLYGAGAGKVATSIAEATQGEIVPTMDEAEGYKKAVLERMPGVGSWIRYQERLAQREGAVTTLIGRPRHLPDAQQRENMKAFYGAMRRAVNTAVQGTAADIIAIAKRNTRRVLQERGWWRREVILALQVHDELVFDVDENVVEEAAKIVKDEMESVITLDVPLIAEPEIGETWYDAK